MEEKKIDALKDVYEKLSDEQKIKADACKSADEFLKLLGEWDIELPDEFVEQVAGGADYWDELSLEEARRQACLEAGLFHQRYEKFVKKCQQCGKTIATNMCPYCGYRP